MFHDCKKWIVGNISNDCYFSTSTDLSLFNGGKVLLRILIRRYPRGKDIPAMTNHAFVAAILVFPFAIRNSCIRASMAYTSVRRWSLTNHARSLSHRVHCWWRTRQSITLCRIRMHQLLLRLLLLLLVVLYLLRLLLYLLHLLLRYLCENVQIIILLLAFNTNND